MSINGGGKGKAAKEYAKGDLQTIAQVLNRIVENRVVRLTTLLVTSIVFLSFILYFSPFPPSGNVRVGELANRDVFAPRSIRVEDQRATEFEKAQAMKKVFPVFNYDPTQLELLEKNIHQAFSYMRDYIEDILSLSATLTEAKAKKVGSSQQRLQLLLQDEPKRRQVFEKMLGIHLSDQEYAILKRERFSPLIEKKLIRLIRLCSGHWIIRNRGFLASKQIHGMILRDVVNHKETVVHDVGLIFDLEDMRDVLIGRSQGILKGLPPEERCLIQSMAQQILKPNVFYDPEATLKLKEEVMSNIHPIVRQIRKGDIIIRRGERITKEQVERLQAMERETTPIWKTMNFIGFLVITFFLLFLPYDFSIKNIRKVKFTPRDLVFLSILLVLFPLMLKFSYYVAFAVKAVFPFLSARNLLFLFPLAAAGMFVRVALNSEIVLLFSVVLSVLSAMIADFSVSFGIIVFLMNLLGAELVSRCEKRSKVLWAGLASGILGGVLIAANHMVQGTFFSYTTAWGVFFAILGGFISGVVVLGLTPPLEAIFGYTTDVKLLELANLDHPLLKEMVLKAPGTYHHSIIVASLAEAAARDIGAHPILVRVGAYYHDIGKIKKPFYFIENQQQGVNRHDKLTPSMSSLILISHVKEGVELAKAYHLGHEIIDIIRQHHGTSLIRFFYNKAVEAAGGNAEEVDEKVFRYPGPKPQTREAGLIMLADAVEATTRALESPTPARINAIVQDTINRIFIDGQLDECELTLKNLHQIADRFRIVLMAIFHHRIDYPSEGKDAKKERGEKWSMYGRKINKIT